MTNPSIPRFAASLPHHQLYSYLTSKALTETNKALTKINKALTKINKY